MSGGTRAPITGGVFTDEGVLVLVTRLNAVLQLGRPEDVLIKAIRTCLVADYGSANVK